MWTFINIKSNRMSIDLNLKKKNKNLNDLRHKNKIVYLITRRIKSGGVPGLTAGLTRPSW